MEIHHFMHSVMPVGEWSGTGSASAVDSNFYVGEWPLRLSRYRQIRRIAPGTVFIGARIVLSCLVGRCFCI